MLSLELASLPLMSSGCIACATFTNCFVELLGNNASSHSAVSGIQYRFKGKFV